MNELKPCPFCGGEAELKRKQFAEDASEAAWIECKSCGAMSTVWSIGLSRIPPRARIGDGCFGPVRNAWNRRVEDNE